MKRSQRLRRPQDFARARTQGRRLQGAALSLTWVANRLPSNRFGYVVNKRVGGAVTRNLVKRRLRAIMQARHTEILPGYDIVLTAQPVAAQSLFSALESDVTRLLQRARLFCPPSDEGQQGQPAPAMAKPVEEEA